jgi:uncharacterized radical SAM superfamily Fe-S cluster-containing enzyme
MVTDWTPQEEEAWSALSSALSSTCPTPQQTLEAAQAIREGYVYLCAVCGEHHVSRLSSSWQQLELPLPDVPTLDRTFPTS